MEVIIMIEEVRKIVSEKLGCSAHDLEHTFRVYNNCLRISENMKNVDLEVLKYASLLHDIARIEEDNDNTGKTDHALLGAEQAREILTKLGKNKDFIDKVSSAIRTHRYRNGLIPETIEGKILYDADKLDVIGMIGICRSYMIAGEYKQRIYNDSDLSEYIKTNLEGGKTNGKIKDISLHSPNIEFLTKDINIPNTMFTETGKKIARKRIKKMQEFFDDLKDEINGND